MRSLNARTGLGVGAGLTKAATVPACAACAAYPLIAAPLAAVGLFGIAAVLHNMLVFLAPLNLIFLTRTYRRHRRPWALGLATVGVLFILGHLAFHVIPSGHAVMQALYPYEYEVGMAFIWIGMLLLAAGAALDWRASRRPRALVIRA